MINKAIKILSALLLIALSLYIVTQNSAQITVYLTPGWSMSTNTGVILIVTFAFGIVCASLVAGYFALKARLRQIRLENREKERLTFLRGFVEARSLLAAGEWDKARAAWERILKKDQSNVMARVELSRCLESAGDVQEALKVIDSARLKDPGNVEVLFRAAELNLELNNKTAAIDNLALILYHQPNLKAARLARDLSEDLNRLQDACEYQEKVRTLGEKEDALRRAQAQLEYKKLLEEYADVSDAAGRGKLAQALRSLNKQFPEHLPSLEHLSALEAEAGRIDDAAQLLIKAAKMSGVETYWHQASLLWINNQMADRAVAAARAATRNTVGRGRVKAELYLIRLLLQLGKLDECKPLIEGFRTLARDEKVDLSPELDRSLDTLESLYLNQTGQYKESAAVLERLVVQAG